MMHLGLIKLTQIPLRGATQVLGVKCIFETGSKYDAQQAVSSKQSSIEFDNDKI
jgi:hypothetical protein